jgi:hypothetical protein
MNPRTQRYVRYGIHSIKDYSQKQAWQRHLNGEAVPLTELPTNGEHCPERTMGGYCGFPLLIDATCPNYANHRDVVGVSDDESEVTNEMVDAAFEHLGQCGVWTHQIGYDDMRVAIEAALRAREE